MMPFGDQSPDEIALRSPLGSPVQSPLQSDGTVKLRLPLGVPEEPEETDGVLAAGLRQDNPVVSTIARLSELGQYTPEPGYSAWPIIKDTYFEEFHWQDFVGDQSERETRDRMARIERQNRDRRILESNGALGVAAQVVAGVLDPIILLPGGALVKSARLGYSVRQSARSVASATAIQATASEGVLQASQDTRTAMESVINVSAATLLGGLIGGGAASLLTKAQRQALETEIAAMQKAGLHADVGAAAADVRQMELKPLMPFGAGEAFQKAREKVATVPYVGKTAAAVMKLPEKIAIDTSPYMRVMTKPFLSARRALGDLAEGALAFEDAKLGITPSRWGMALDREARLLTNKAVVEVLDTMDRAFAEYRHGSAAVKLPKLRAEIDRYIRGNTEFLSPAEFRREVGMALARGDRHSIPQVATVAKKLRETVFDPWKERAQQTGLLPEELGDPKTAESYVMRIWNKEALRARRTEAEDIFVGWLRQDQETKRAAQERIGALSEQMKGTRRQLKRLSGRLGTQQRKQAELETRLSERGMEEKRTAGRVATLDERSRLMAEEISDLQEFIESMRADLRSPELTERLKELEAELRVLQAAEKRSQISEKDLAKIEKAERQSILSGDNRRVANVLIGKAELPKPMTMLGYMAKHGGISERDAGGEIRALLGVTGRRDLRGIRSKAPPGLIRENGKSLDQWIEHFHGESPEAFGGREAYGGDAVSTDVLLDYIREDLAGSPPAWWVQARLSNSDLAVREQAAAWQAALDVAGVEVKTLDDVAALWRGDDPAVLDDLERAAAEMEAAGADIPIRFEREGVEEQVTVKREAIAGIRQSIADARKGKGRLQRRVRDTGIRTDEAEMAARAQRGRLGVLSDRTRLAAIKEELLQTATLAAEEHMTALRANIEGEIAKWEGKSAIEGQSALRARDKAEAERAGKLVRGESKSKGGRLASADDAIDHTVKRILASDRDRPEAEIRSLASEIIDRIVSSPDGRLPYDAPNGGPRVGAPSDLPPPRGPLAHREFAIPDEMVEEFLERDAEQVMWSYLRSIVPDVLLTERFGDVEMRAVFKSINEEAAAMSRADPARAKEIGRERDIVITALAGMRDRVRHVYGWSSAPLMQHAGRIAEAVKAGNILLDAGGMGLAQIPDAAGATLRWGLERSFRAGWMPYLRHLMTGLGDEVVKHSQRQLRAMGIGAESWLQTRSHDLADITDVYQPRSIPERTLSAAANKFMVANLVAPATDAMKFIAGSVTMDAILDLASKTVKGDRKAIARLAEAGIAPEMAERIWRQFEADPQSFREGVFVPNLANWNDAGARLAFEAAVNREVDIAVITPGQEKALVMSQPVLSTLGQFKSFIGSATVRLMLANLQKRDAASLAGLLTSIGLGALSYKLRAIASGHQTHERPQDWVKEGIDRSGILGWFSEGNAIAAKVTGGSVDVYRLVGADKPLSRYASRSVLGALLGPTAGKIEHFSQVTRAASTGEWTQSDVRALRRLTAMQNLFYLRRLFDEVERSGADLFDIPERRQ